MNIVMFLRWILYVGLVLNVLVAVLWIAGGSTEQAYRDRVTVCVAILLLMHLVKFRDDA